MLTLYPTALLHSFISSVFLVCKILRVFYIYNHIICKQIILLRPFQHRCPVSFAELTALARNSSTMLNKNGESRHSCLVPDLRRKPFSLSLLSMTFTMGFSCVAFIVLRESPSTPSFFSVLW